MRINQIFVNATLFLCLTLAGCATSYGPNGMTGGYKEAKVNDHTYEVYFFGNGHTSGDTVWYYWIYRCAELTKEKGFTAFTLTPLEKKTSSAAPQTHYSGYSDKEAPVYVKTKGGGAPTYIYVPGQTITTYSSRAVVTMYSAPYPEGIRFLINPEKVLEALKPYVESGGKAIPPPRREVLDKALIAPTTPV